MGKRPAAWRESNVRHIGELEFPSKADPTRLDLELSVYRVTVPADVPARNVVLQVHAEHAGSFLETPPLSIVDVDMDGLHSEPPVRTDGKTAFRFTLEAHHILRFQTENDLLDVVRRVLMEFPTRAFEIGREEVLAYARGRIDAGDEEWVRAKNDGKVRKWKTHRRERPSA